MKRALELHAFDEDGWCLLSLILSAQRRDSDAVAAITAAIKSLPPSFMQPSPIRSLTLKACIAFKVFCYLSRTALQK